MKKKAMLKTAIDISKFCGALLLYFIGGPAIIFLLTLIPYWFLNAFGLWEKYADYPAGVIYGTELLIIAGIILAVWLIRAQYLKNLQILKDE